MKPCAYNNWDFDSAVEVQSKFESILKLHAVSMTCCPFNAERETMTIMSPNPWKLLD